MKQTGLRFVTTKLLQTSNKRKKIIQLYKNKITHFIKEQRTHSGQKQRNIVDSGMTFYGKNNCQSKITTTSENNLKHKSEVKAKILH